MSTMLQSQENRLSWFIPTWFGGVQAFFQNEVLVQLQLSPFPVSPSPEVFTHEPESLALLKQALVDYQEGKGAAFFTSALSI